MNNNEKIKKIIIISIIILFILLISILFMLISIYENQDEEIGDDSSLTYESLETIEDVIKYYNCTYISLVASTVQNYNFDINLKFSKPLYENNKSNETFYQNIIKDLARMSRYQNFRLIDEENGIKIEVICKDASVYNIIINGIEDYFIYMNSQLSLRQYKKIETTQFSVESQIILDAIHNNWSKEIYLGTRDSIYNQYYIYFDEGIKVRNIDSKIYNIIFTNKYLGPIVNNITTQTTVEEAQRILGKPAFEDKELGVIGYKGIDFYIFFTESQVSVYRVDKISMESFFMTIDEFLNQKIDFLELMNELTYLWPDYSDYEYTANKVFLSYPQKGVDVKINYDNTTAILLYNNFNSELSTIEKYLENTEFMGILQIDNVFEAEKRRIKNENEKIEKLLEYKKENIPTGYISMLYDCYPTYSENNYITKLEFISKNENLPNREINDTFNDFLWINDENIVFSKKNKGIYKYNVYTARIEEIIVNDFDEFELIKYENGFLIYDNKEIYIEF